MILEAPFPPDIRVENEAEALTKAGYRVYIFSLRFNHIAKYEPFTENLFVTRMKLNQGFFNKIRVTVLKFPFYHFLWLTFLRRTTKSLELDAIHVHDLPLAGIGRRIARERDIPFVLDLHENYPAALKIWSHSKKVFGGTFLNPNRWLKYEEEMVRSADRVIVVVEEAISRFLEKEIAESKFVVVSNTLNIARFSTQEGQQAEVVEKTDFTIMYAGGFGPHRGLRVAIMAMPEILKKIPTAKLVLVGDGSDLADLKNLTVRCGVEEKVVFTGWVQMNAVPHYLLACDIGIIPYLSTEHTETTIPHKLFQYMYLRKPVIVSDCKPLQRIVTETQAGLVFKSGDETDFAACVIKLHADKRLRTGLGENGRKSVERQYNWQHTSGKLIELYEGLHNKRA